MAKKHKFPVEKFGPKLLALLESKGKVRDALVDNWGSPRIEGIELKALGKTWKIHCVFAEGFIAYDTETKDRWDGTRGRFRWEGKFIEAEEDFDYDDRNTRETTDNGHGAVEPTKRRNIPAKDVQQESPSLFETLEG